MTLKHLIAALPGARGRSLVALAGLALLAGCDIPTSVPRWETRWVVPAENTTIDVPSLLPSGIIVSSDGTELIASISSTTISETLGDLCSACAAVNGTTVPKPAFSATLDAATSFPVEIDSVTLTRGSIEIRVANGMGFDPLRPSAAVGAPRGSFVVTIRSGSTVISSRTIDGAVKSLPSGGTLVDTITFDPAVLPRSIGSPVETEVTLHSPAGDPVAINTAQSMSVTIEEASIAVSAAMVRVQGRSVSAEPVSLDLDDLDAQLTDRVRDGALLLSIDNPFSVAGSVTATISAPGVTLNRDVTIVPGHSEPIITFSQQELQQLFGKIATLTVSGIVDAVPFGGLVTVTPSMVLTVNSRLQLNLATEIEEDGQ